LKSGLDTKKRYDKNLTVEIIIPTLNEESSIGDVIRSIKDQSLPVKTSILVIDGGSTDRTIEICEEEKVPVIRQIGTGKGNAMKESIDHTDSEIVVFIDGDGTYSADDLGKLLSPILQNKADMVVGSRLIGKKEKIRILFISIT